MKKQKHPRIIPGVRIYHNDKLFYERRKDGYYDFETSTSKNMRHIPMGLVEVEEWDTDGAWWSLKYDVRFPKEDLFDQLYRRMI